MPQTYEIKSRFTGESLFSYELKEGQEIGMIARHAVEAAVASRANLRGAWLVGAYLQGANLRGADLEDANLRDTNLRDANLEGANLEGTNLENAWLVGAYLEDANLRGANLEGAYLEGANLEDANLEGANLEGAYLVGVIGNRDYIKSMQFDDWHIAYTSTHLSIGGQSHPIDAWRDWKNKPEWIAEMEVYASDWAEKYIDLALRIIDLSPAKPTNISE